MAEKLYLMATECAKAILVAIMLGLVLFLILCGPRVHAQQLPIVTKEGFWLALGTNASVDLASCAARYQMDNDAWLDSINNQTGTASSSAMVFTNDCIVGTYAGVFTNTGYITMYSNTLLSAVTSISFSCWAKLRANNNYSAIWGVRSPYYCALYQEPVYSDAIQVGVTTVAGASYAYRLTPITTNVWHHLAWTWDSSGRIDIYIDGIVGTRSGQTGTGAFPATGANYIGVDPYDLAARRWNGYIDEVKFYKNRILTSNEIFTAFTNYL